MGKHIPCLTWALRRVGKYPQAYVETRNSKALNISFFPDDSGLGNGFEISRGDAKLLARRITQCLEATK